MTDFWERMRHAFGDSYADSVARDQQIASLDHRTVRQALADGEEIVTVWRAVHEHFELPARDR
jgi:hypothetical protein